MLLLVDDEGAVVKSTDGADVAIDDDGDWV